MRPTDWDELIVALTEAWAEDQWNKCGPGIAAITKMPLEFDRECRQSVEHDAGQSLTPDDEDMVADAYQSWVEDLITERVNETLCAFGADKLYPFGGARSAVRTDDWRVVIRFSATDRRELKLAAVADVIAAELERES